LLVDHILKLQDVAWPVIAQENVACAGRDALNIPVALAGDLSHEVIDKEGNILAPLAKRREMNLDNVEAIVQILSELPVLHGLPQVRVRRSEDPDINVTRPHAAEPLYLALLEDP
jgi:hypothetical protein